ncbi:MAG: hypothetical protein V1925_00735 [Candidatus Omnitrophota bacterium]
MIKWKDTNACIFIFFALLCSTVYFNSLHNELLFDEQAIIVNNPYLHNLKFIPHIFSGESQPGSGYYRPVADLIYATGYYFWGLNPLGYHIISIALEALNAFLIFLLIKLLFKDRLLAFLTGVLFCIHPIHSKTVAIIENKELAFTLLSIILAMYYAKKEKFYYYLFSFLCFIMAVLCRESGLLIPLMIILSALIYGADKKKVIIGMLPFFLLGAAYFLLRQTFVPVEQLKVNLPELLRRMPPFFYYCHKYIRQIILMPYGFVAGPLATRIIHFAAFIGPLLFYGAVIRFLWLKNKVVIFACLFFSLAIFPLLNLTGKIALYGPIVFDDYAYMASLGIILIFAYFFRRLSVFIPKTAFIFFIFVALFYSSLNVRYNNYYKNEESYYHYIISFDKDCAFAHAGLANIYYHRGMLAEAESEAREALPWGDEKKTSRVYSTLGSIYSRRGELDKGIEYFTQAINSDPEYDIPYANLALVYVVKGNNGEAYRNFQQALRLNPAGLFTLGHFSKFLVFQGRYPEAIDICGRILELKPDDVDARITLGEISHKLGIKNAE